MHEGGFVAASVHGDVGPGDQTVGAAPFFLHGLGEGQIDTCTVYRLLRHRIQVAARDADVGRHVGKGRALRILHRDDLRVLRHVACGVCGGPGAVDLELRAARPVDDLLEELNRAAEVVGGGVAAGVVGVPIGTVVVHVDARHLDEPIGAVCTNDVAPLQGHVLGGAQEDRRCGVQALPELGGMLREAGHRVDRGVHQFHVFFVANRRGNFRRCGVGNDVSGQARHRRAVQDTLPAKPTAKPVFAVVVVGPVAKLESLGLGSRHVVQVKFTSHGPCSDEAGHGVFQTVHLHLGGVDVAFVLGQQARAGLGFEPFGGVLLRFEVDVHIEGDRRVVCVDHRAFQVGRAGTVVTGQRQRVGRVFQKVIRGCAGLDRQPVDAHHSVGSGPVRGGQRMRGHAQFREGVDAAEDVGLVANVERLSLGVARQRQILRTFHSLVGQPIQKVGSTKGFHVVVDAEAAGGVHVDLLGVTEGVHFNLKGVATAVVEVQQRCAIAEVLGPLTHDDFGAVDHRVHVSAGGQHDLEVVGQPRREFVLPTSRGDSDGEVVEIRPAEVARTWAVAHPALVECSNAVVHVVADHVPVLVGQARASAHAEGVLENAAAVVGVGLRVVVAGRGGVATRNCGDARAVVVEHRSRVVSHVVDGVRVGASAAFAVARAKREGHADLAVGVSVFKNLHRQLARKRSRGGDLGHGDFEVGVVASNSAVRPVAIHVWKVVPGKTKHVTRRVDVGPHRIGPFEFAFVIHLTW